MSDAATTTATDWRASACILCSINCGVEVRTEDRRITRVRGDKSHPGSQGYTCEKALRLDHYQNARDRLTSPMRRRADGTFEAVDWDTAIAEVAARLAAVRDEHGGASIFYYGGGGQGNHLGGGYGRSLRAAVGSVYTASALSQEKTGEFWVDGQLFGRPKCHTTGDYEHAEVAMFVGKNPWQSHGFPRARVVLKEIAKDPTRALIVIDPRRTESAELADFHLQVKPGTDAWCLGAILKVLVDEDADRRRRSSTCTPSGTRSSSPRSRSSTWTAGARSPASIPTTSAPSPAASPRPRSVSIFEDLGIQQAPHSTLSSYLEKLVYLVTGNFAKEGGMNIHTAFASLAGGGKAGVDRRTPVGGHRIITGLVPGAAIPDEILTDHPDRFRAMIVESGNPVHSLPDSQRMREALAALEFVRRDRRRDDRDRPLRRLRAPGREPVREVGGHVLHAGVPAQLLPAPAAAVRSAPRHAAGAGDPSPAGAGARRRTPTTTSRRCTRPRRRVGPSSPTRSSPRWWSSRTWAATPGWCCTRRSAPRSARATRARPRCGGSRRRAS